MLHIQHLRRHPFQILLHSAIIVIFARNVVICKYVCKVGAKGGSAGLEYVFEEEIVRMSGVCCREAALPPIEVGFFIQCKVVFSFFVVVQAEICCHLFASC